MDYKYIEQLIERYFQAETSLEEEQILRSFFSQDNLPEEFSRYSALFRYEDEEKKVSLGDSFDERIMRLVGEEAAVKARRITLLGYMRPMLRAAAVLALLFSAVNIAQRSFSSGDETGDGYDYEAYKDTYDDSSVAVKEVTSALEMVSSGLVREQADSLAMDVPQSETE